MKAWWNATCAKTNNSYHSGFGGRCVLFMGHLSPGGIPEFRNLDIGYIWVLD